MSDLATSYFRSKADAYRKVCIAKKTPAGFRGLHVSALAPSHPWVSNWQERYWQDLSTRFPGGAGLKELLDRIAEKVPFPILCCYEAKRSECHRAILAEYIERYLGIKVPEWPHEG